MYIYNLTINVESSIQTEWLKWMKEEYIPKMLATEKFEKSYFSRLLRADQEGVTYSVQFFSPSRETLKQYYIESHGKMMKELEKFKEKIVFFGSEMEVIDQQS